MGDKKLFHSRGRTGREGVALKFFGMVAAAVGLLWAFLTYVLSDSGTGLIAPLCIMAAGLPVFLVGRSLARSSAVAGA